MAEHLGHFIYQGGFLTLRAIQNMKIFMKIVDSNVRNMH